jgi:arylsulfatase A-like enzyme
MFMASKKITRREVLKLMGLGSLAMGTPQFLFQAAEKVESVSPPNVLVVVFDAFSAHNISLYGYPRVTTPNLDRLAEKAVVYHNHYANGNFTTPGTASLLTGTLPWTHQAFNHNDTVIDANVDHNIFRVFQNHHRMAYSHNLLVNTLLKQFLPEIDDYTPQGALFLDDDRFLHTVFGKDEDIATLAWTRTIKQKDDGTSYSLFAPRIYEQLKGKRAEELKDNFPRGLPNVSQDNYYTLEDGIDWLQNLTLSAPQPFFGYFHFLPPHFPYKTRKDFYQRFDQDGYRHPQKPRHPFANQGISEDDLADRRRWYDEYILYVDAEFARLYEFLEKNKILENTWVILTSDHGEMFERGISGHQKPVLYDPVVKIPLLIFEPKRMTRLDVFEPSSAVDLLPMLATVSGYPIPSWVEGNFLPPYNSSSQDSPRDIYAIESRSTGKREPIQNATAMLRHHNYKLKRYWGYEQFDTEVVELFNLEKDPEELDNIVDDESQIAEALLAKLQSKLTEAEQEL